MEQCSYVLVKVIYYCSWSRCWHILMPMVLVLFRAMWQILWSSTLTKLSGFNLLIDLVILVYTFSKSSWFVSQVLFPISFSFPNILLQFCFLFFHFFSVSFLFFFYNCLFSPMNSWAHQNFLQGHLLLYDNIKTSVKVHPLYLAD